MICRLKNKGEGRDGPALLFHDFLLGEKLPVMSIDLVKQYLSRWGRDGDVREFPVSSATVELAAAALNVEPGRIAKTLSFVKEDGCLLVVAAGNVRVDNAKFKQAFGFKARMLSPDLVPDKTGYAVGGVCPFALPETAEVYLDQSLREFSTVFPACGSSNSAIELTKEELEDYSGSKGWVDVCKRKE